MSNIIFIASVLATVIWGICYLLAKASPVIHIFLVIAFIGTLVSVVIDEKKQVSKQ